jgi:hypothetical protein
LLIGREIKQFVALAKSTEIDEEDLILGEDIDDGLSLNSENLDRNFRGLMSNMTYGISLPGQNVDGARKMKKGVS